MWQSTFLISAVMFLSLNVLAMDEHWHQPEVKQEILAMMKRQADDKAHGVAECAALGASGGAMLPWATAFSLGVKIANGHSEGKGDSEQMFNATRGGILATLLCSLPCI